MRPKLRLKLEEIIKKRRRNIQLCETEEKTKIIPKIKLIFGWYLGDGKSRYKVAFWDGKEFASLVRDGKHGGWGTFKQMLEYKAITHQAKYLEVSEAFTTESGIVLCVMFIMIVISIQQSTFSVWDIRRHQWESSPFRAGRMSKLRKYGGRGEDLK